MIQVECHEEKGFCVGRQRRHIDETATHIEQQLIDFVHVLQARLWPIQRYLYNVDANRLFSA